MASAPFSRARSTSCINAPSEVCTESTRTHSGASSSLGTAQADAGRRVMPREALLALGLALLALGAGALASGRQAAAARETELRDQVSQQAPALAGTRLLVPALETLEVDEQDCVAWIAVQNVGDEPTSAILLTWPEPSESGCNGPLKAECTGLIKPGSAWNLRSRQMPTGSVGGMLFSISPKLLSETTSELYFDDLASEYLCDRAYFSVVGQCEKFVDFVGAYDAGTEFLGVPLAEVRGQPLAVDIWRACKTTGMRSVWATSTYPAVDPSGHGRTGTDRTFQYFAPRIVTGGDDQDTILHVQNAGASDAEVGLMFQNDGSDSAPIACEQVSVRPGETYRYRASDFVGRDWSGSAVVTATESLGVVADLIGLGTLASYSAVAAEPPSLIDPAPSAGSPEVRLYGPVAQHSNRSGTVVLSVMNTSGLAAADVEVQFLDASGAVLKWLSDTITPFGSQSFELPASGAALGHGAASIRVTSRSSADVTEDAPPIAAAAEVNWWGYKRLGGKSAHVLAPESELMSSMITAETTGSPGTRAVALPIFEKDLDDRNFSVTTELALADLVPEPGWTDVAVLIFDRNDLVDVLCRRLDAGEVQYVNLQHLGAIDPGFNGTAIVSATYWEHLDSAATQPPTGRVGISAALVTRYGTVAGQDIPGDEVSVTMGTPLERLPDTLADEVGDPCADDPQPRPTPVVPSPGPRDAALQGMVHLPVLSYRMSEDVCEAAVEVVNSGSEPAYAMLVAFGEEGFCEPQCSGPLLVACSGLIAPGGRWQFGGSGELAGAASGVIFSMNSKSLAEAGAETGSDALAAEYVCLEASAEVIANCEEYRRLRLAYNAGGKLGGVPMGNIVGPPLEVSLTRICGDLADPSKRTESSYTGRTGVYYDALHEAPGGYWQSVVPIYADHKGRFSVLYLQNTGLECTGVDLWFKARGDCLYERKCNIAALAPGEMRPFPAADCVGPDQSGTVVVHSDMPLAVDAETLAEGVQATYDAIEGASPFDIDGDGYFGLSDVSAFEDALNSVPGDPNWNPRADLNKDGAVDEPDREWLDDSLCGLAPPSGIVPSLGAWREADQVGLPLLRAEGDCESTIAIQNIGDEPGEAAVVFWGERPDGDECPGPIDVVCTGLIAPGGSWHVARSEIDAEAQSAMAFSFSAETADTDFAIDPPPSYGEWLCEQLTYGAVGDCDEYSEFKAAFDSKGEYAFISLADAQGPPLAVGVSRSCTSSEPPGGPLNSGYSGAGANLFGRFDESIDGYEYHVPLIYSKGFVKTRLYVQNVGDEPTEAMLHLRHQTDCSHSWTCAPREIEPGQMVSFGPESSDEPCFPVDFQGSGRLVSAEPLAIVAENAFRSSSAAYSAVPRWRDFDARGNELPEAASYVAYSPLAYDHNDGWDVGVQVANLRRSGIARVNVEFLDENGTPVSTLTDEICPNGAQTYFLPVEAASDTLRVGSVRVQSLRTVGEPELPPAPIASVSYMMQYSDAARGQVIGAVSLNLAAEAEAFDWPVGADEGGLASGSGVVALPLVAKNGSSDGLSGEISIANVVRAPGATDVALWLFDQNGLVDIACHTLGPGHVEYVDLQDMARLQPGFRGSAIVSAYSWTHEVAIEQGNGRRSLVGIAAALVARSGARYGDGSAADVAGALLGTPLLGLPATDDAPADPCGPPPDRSEPIYLPLLTVDE